MEDEAEFFLKVKRLIAKCIGTQKQLQIGFLFVQWDFRNVVTVSRGIFDP